MNPTQHTCRRHLSRREWLTRTGFGFGGLALAALLSEEARGEDSKSADPLAPKKPHFVAKAKRVIHVFLEGGPSHVDTFDPKPKLSQNDGKPIQVFGEERKAIAFGSPFKFSKHGKSGLEVSDAFPEVAKLADELCVVRSMHTDDPGHEQAVLMMNTGDTRLARPSVGSWVTYGLGTGNRDLPAFVAMYNEGMPVKGAENWQAAFLPGLFQGTAIDTQNKDIEKLIEHIRSPIASGEEQRLQLDLLRELNQKHASGGRSDDPRLEAKIESFELAYRMQTAAGEAFDVAREPKRVRALYGESPVGRQCLIARRLLERGVRFVQVYNSGWDHHDTLAENLRNQSKDLDRALAGLLTDLEQRGLLADTLVVCCGEFGRTPAADGSPTSIGKNAGRDHNNRGFTALLAGGGVRGGLAYGATDEFGFAAVEGKVHVHDLHATMLHLLGLDHEKLTYRYSGRDFRLTDIAGTVVKKLIA
jgi:hypothetical protein